MNSTFFDKYFNDSALLSEKCAKRVRQMFFHSSSVLCDLACEYDADFKAEDFVFTFSDTNERIRREATRELRSLYSNVYSEIRGGVVLEWDLANRMIDDMISNIFEGRIDLGRHHPQRWFSRNREAMDAFFARKSAYGGLNLSQRVWRCTGSFRNEIELALSVSMGEGVPASKVAKEVQKCLNEPERLFRRVRDEDGNLRLSKKAREYNPGRGVYRSSYMNAMRLARTETNMAFRAADYERQQGLDFVVGQEIRLSNNHTTKLPNGKVVEFTDICDELKGRYPKDFKFVGWHPHCRCHTIPILKTEDEMDEDADLILDGKEPTADSMNSVEDVPSNFDEWMSKNADRIDSASKKGTLPYFLRDNKAFVE